MRTALRARQTLRDPPQQFPAQFLLFFEHGLQVPQHVRLADLPQVFAGLCRDCEQIRQWVVSVHRATVQQHNESVVTTALEFRG